MDYAIAIDILRPAAKWRRSDDYAALAATWEDETTIPTDAELIAAYNTWQTNETSKANIITQIEAGYPVTPEGFTLAMGDNDRKAWAELLVMVNEGKALAQMTDLSEITIRDINNVSHTVTVLRYRQIIFGLGAYYKSLWDQLQD